MFAGDFVTLLASLDMLLVATALVMILFHRDFLPIYSWWLEFIVGDESLTVRGGGCSANATVI